MLMNRIAPQNEVTVKNLLTAFESESNAHNKYTAYAEKAESEGMFGTASLLRAAARSEQIHASNHAHIIRQLGGEPEAEIQPVEVRTTRENLTTALGDEIYEIESMYPRFLVENRHANNSAARTLTWALEAEKTHASLLNEEIQRFEADNTDSSLFKSAEFYVRPACGYVSKAPEPERCWVCERFCAKFEIVR
jgi:rubrerythrin